MLFILFRIASLFFFFISDLLWIKPLKSGISNYLLIFLRSVFTSILFLILWLFAKTTFIEESINYKLLKADLPTDLFFYIKAITLCLFSFWGLYFFTSSIKINKFSFVAPLANLGFIFAILTSIFIYETTVKAEQIIAILIFIATILIVIKRANLSEFKIYILPIILTHFFWDTAVVFYPFIINKIGVIPFCLLMELCVLFSSGSIVLINNKNNQTIISSKDLLLALSMAFVICSAVFLFSVSLVNLSVIIVITLGLLTKLARISYGYIYLNERLNKNELIILTLMIIGGIMASL